MGYGGSEVDPNNSESEFGLSEFLSWHEHSLSDSPPKIFKDITQF